MVQIITNSNWWGWVWLYKYKGSVDYYEDLPTSWMKIWDVYNVVNEHTTAPVFPAWTNVAWTGTERDALWWSIDLSEYQKKLVEWTGIDIDQDTNEISVEADVINWAAAWATAVQPWDDVSTLTNDAGYINKDVNDLTYYTKSSDLATVATSWSYNDLSNKPTIWNAKLTIQKNGTDVNSITMNATTNVTANISVPTDTSDLTNGAGFVDKDVNNLTYYTPTSSLSTVATSGSYSDLSNKPTIWDATIKIQKNGTDIDSFTTNTTSGKTINVVVPTKVTDLSDASDYVKDSDLATVATTWAYSDLSWTPTLATVATSWSYNDLSDKPTIWTANLKIQKNWTDVATFWANATSAVTANITVPTKVTDLSDASNYALKSWLATVATSGSYTDLSNNPTIPSVVDNLTSTSTTNALSANQWKVLKGLIDTYAWLGRFLSLWNSKTGMPISFPLTTPYTYKTWDWFMVEIVDTTDPITNYKPNGSSYTWAASTTVESWTVKQWDVYIYDGTDWLLQVNNEPQVSFSEIAWQPTDNSNLATALGNKQDVSNMVTSLTWADNTHYPTAKAVADAISWAGNGDMLKSVYDPNNVNADAFDYTNFINTPSLATVATSGAYSDLSWTPTLATVATSGSYTDLSNKPNLATVATSGSYTDLSNKPTIPTVNNAILTIQKNWTTVDTFTANASSNVTANITVPTKVSDLTNDSWFVTNQVSDAAYASSWNWVTWIAPSKNAVYDKIETLPSTAWNGIDITNKVVSAKVWTGLEIWDDYSAMQWPCPSGFHVPSKNEWVALCWILTTTFSLASNATTMGTYLKMPKAGRRLYDNASVNNVGSIGYYWSSTPNGASSAYDLYFNSSSISPQHNSYRSYGFSVRCFKDFSVVPDSSWTTLYDWSSVATWAWVFWNSALWLISVSGDGTTWYTIQDKNLWATTVYNQWDTLIDANVGWCFQWWNNYMFLWTKSSGTITKSATKVDASWYWPWNYYSSSTWITTNPWNSNATATDNLRWWQTWVVSNAILNAWVTSVNGQTGDVTIDSGITKIFTLSSSSDLTNAQAAYDWYAAGKTPIIYINYFYYHLYEVTSTYMYFGQAYSSNANRPIVKSIRLWISSWTVTSITYYSANITTHSTTTCTLTSAWWSSKSQTVSVTGVTSSNTVIVSPAPADIADYADCGVYGYWQWSWTLTFNCDTVPSGDITVNVLIFN